FDDESTRKECYNVIISESKRLSTLVEDILSVSQLEVGSLRLELADVDILKLMRAMVQDNLGRADAKQIDLRLKLPPKAPAVRGDKQRLAILISNLIGNAIKYTPSGGQVDVHLEAQDDSLRITVADTGIGIAESDQKHVFDKFYRVASEAVQQTSGTGLGLAIAREIARLHGGDIELQSALGRGSTLIVELPASPQGASVGASS
ncbi:MAG: sensor histidine kinase, partial [Dehalococcoidia bacterium]